MLGSGYFLRFEGLKDVGGWDIWSTVLSLMKGNGRKLNEGKLGK